jgi:hypothetical protein
LIERGNATEELCETADDVINDDMLASAIQNAERIADLSITETRVKSCIGEKWRILFLNEYYILCLINSTSWKLFGENFVLSATDFQTSKEFDYS